MVWRTVICLIEFIYVVNLKANLPSYFKSCRPGVRLQNTCSPKWSVGSIVMKENNITIMILMSISMCKHFHRRYASKWFVWIGGTIYINIEKKDESEFTPPLEFNIFKNIQQCSERELIYFFFINLPQLFACTQWQYTCMKTWTDSSI